MAFQDYFPNLTLSGFRITSPVSKVYNCFAWAAGQTDCWWEPNAPDDSYWPAGSPRERTISAIIQALGTLGFVPADNDQLEPGFEKVALYAKDDVPTHAARQLNDGKWTSKLGDLEDIEHTLDGLVSPFYGAVVQILKRPMHKP